MFLTETVLFLIYKEKCLPILPVKYKECVLTKENSIITNGETLIGQSNLINKVKDNVQLLKSLKEIRLHYNKPVHQIVFLNNKIYLNPYFIQPSLILSKKIVTSGHVNRKHKKIIIGMKRLFNYSLYDNKPNYHSICINRFNNDTLITKTCRSYGCPILTIEDYLLLLSRSSIGIYFDI